MFFGYYYLSKNRRIQEWWLINLSYEIIGWFYPSFLINDSIKWLILINPQDRFNSSIPSTSKTIDYYYYYYYYIQVAKLVTLIKISLLDSENKPPSFPRSQRQTASVQKFHFLDHTGGSSFNLLPFHNNLSSISSDSSWKNREHFKKRKIHPGFVAPSSRIRILF